MQVLEQRKLGDFMLIHYYKSFPMQIRRRKFKISGNFTFEQHNFFHYNTLHTVTIKFGTISKIFKQAKQVGKLGKPRIQYIIFLYPNTEIYSLHHMPENILTVARSLLLRR